MTLGCSGVEICLLSVLAIATPRRRQERLVSIAERKVECRDWCFEEWRGLACTDLLGEKWLTNQNVACAHQP